MSEIDINRFLNKFGMNSFHNKQMNARKIAGAAPQNLPQNPNAGQSSTQNIPNPSNIVRAQIVPQNIQIKGFNNAVYARDLFQMPRNLNEFIYMMQRGMTQAQFNQMFANQAVQKNALSQMQAQILAQLQGSNLQQTVSGLDTQLKNIKNLEILSNGLINLNDISIMFQKNGKEALTRLIMTMTEASKAGISDLSQLKEMARLVNAGMAVASENNPTKTLKLLIMLYLPWLPLQDGVEFDLEIGGADKDEEETENVLKIIITTVHFGLVTVTLVLDTSNSIQTVVECCQEFPKKELEERIAQENKRYSMETATTFIVGGNNKNAKIHQASVTMNTGSATKVNPFLLLLAQCIIRHVIELDE